MRERKRKHDDAHRPAFVRRKVKTAPAGTLVPDRPWKLTPGGNVECPYCHWGFHPSAFRQHVREKHE